jgi:hypothetical protein
VLKSNLGIMVLGVDHTKWKSHQVGFSGTLPPIPRPLLLISNKLYFTFLRQVADK